MSRKRYVLEGEWTGYRSSQQRIVHREVITSPDRFKHLHAIQYSDGTSLYLSIREAKLRERVIPILGYSRLIRDAIGFNKARVSVDEMVKEINS